MKKFQVSVDITMSCLIHDVEAETEEEAKTKVKNWIADNPMYYVKDGCLVKTEIDSVDEEEEE